MSTAVIIAGQMRSFDKVWPNQYWMALRNVPDPYFFVSVEDDVDADKVKLLEQRFPANRIFTEKVIQPQIPEPTATLSGPYPASAKPQGILRQLWALNQGWAFFEKTKPEGVRFDTFLRWRPDLHYHSFKWPIRSVYSTEAITPWWSRWGGVCDRVAILGELAAPHYFGAYQKLPQLLADGCPLHPETIMAAALEKGDCMNTMALQAWFSTVRKDGSTIGPDPMIVDLVDYMGASRLA